MNYVFSDGDGAADNNSGSDYATPISGAMTAERWLEEAPLRVVSRNRSSSRRCRQPGDSTQICVAEMPGRKRSALECKAEHGIANCWSWPPSELDYVCRPAFMTHFKYRSWRRRRRARRRRRKRRRRQRRRAALRTIARIAKQRRRALRRRRGGEPRPRTAPRAAARRSSALPGPASRRCARLDPAQTGWLLLAVGPSASARLLPSVAPGLRPHLDLG